MPLSIMDRKTIQKVNKETEDWSNAINQLALTTNYRILHPTTAEQIFFSNIYGIFFRLNLMLGYEPSLN